MVCSSNSKHHGNKNLDMVAEDLELYNIKEDFSMHNLADKYPDKLKEMQKLFDKEAEENNVYPLDDRVVERINPRLQVVLI